MKHNPTECMHVIIVIFVVFKYLSHHCGIDNEDDESVVLTGGSSSPTAVTKYKSDGDATSLPSLIMGRAYHACGKFINADLETVSLGP